MRLIKIIVERSVLMAIGCISFLHLSAQENSPFSRYGLGDVYPGQSITSRGMGGIAAAYSHDQALNTINPASYSAMKFIKYANGTNGGLITYDLGISIDSRTLRSVSQGETYKSINFLPSYITLGVPLSSKASARNRNAGLVFGLKPATRIHYNVQGTAIDSAYSKTTLYEGNGGLNQLFIGVAKRFGNLSLGVNGGYEFGRKDVNSRIILLNDSVNYYKSNSAQKTNFWGLFVTPGISYNIKLNEVKKSNNAYSEGYFLRFGASATLAHSLKASTDTLRETFDYSSGGGTIPIDTVHSVRNVKGNIDLPLTYNAGFMISKKYLIGGNVVASKWSFGADYSAGNWVDYRYYGEADKLINNWIVRVGGEFVPSLTSSRFFSRSTYRLGLYTGKDYINADGNDYNVRALTMGFGFFVKKYTSYDNNSTFINTALEFGKRGSSVNNVTENFFKFSVGLSLADLWFIRRKYD
ncbi:outer membrane protein transport protein [soil metagenome]